MLKRVLTFCVGILIFGQASLIAQEADLAEAKQLILYERLGEASQKLTEALAQAPKNIDEIYDIFYLVCFHS